MSRLWMLVLLCAACLSNEDVGSVEQHSSGGSGPPGDTAPPPPPAINLDAYSRKFRADGGSARSFELWTTKRVTLDEFWTRTRPSFGLGNDDSMHEIKSKLSLPAFPSLPRTNYRYQQKYRGVLVEDAIYTLTTEDGDVRHGMGRLVPGLNLSATPSVAASAAQTTAIAHVAATRYAWEDDPTLGLPTGALSFFSPDFGAAVPFRLVWTVDVATSQPYDVKRVHVDAQTGAVIDSSSRLLTVEAAGTGVTHAGTSVDLTTETYKSGYELSTSTSSNISTLDANILWLPTSFTDLDNQWTETANRRGVSAHFAALAAWTWMVSRGSWGPDDAGTSGRGITTLQFKDVGAAPNCTIGPNYAPKYKTISLCAATPAGTPSVDVETVAHEIGHQLADHTLGGFYGSVETRGLGEHFADFVATSVNYAVTGNDSDWTLYNQSGWGFTRVMNDPNAAQAPDTYGGLYWASAVAGGYEHDLAGVGNRWFSLLAAGGTGTNDQGTFFAVPPLGRPTAEKLVMQALQFLPSRADYRDYREATLRAARMAFDEPSLEYNAVVEAWKAVGLSDAPPPVNQIPAMGAEHVVPWPAEMRFPVPLYTCLRGVPCSPEVSWQIQTSTDVNFPLGLQTRLHEVTTAFALPLTGAQVAYADVDLHAASVYFWRVRGRRADGTLTAWKWVADFETANMAPEQARPADSAVQDRPWDATFDWAPPANVTGLSYQFQIDDDATFVTPLATVTTNNPYFGGIQLQQEHEYFWRVRAKGSSAQGYGAWSTRFHGSGTNATKRERELPWDPSIGLRFTTSRLRVYLTSPTHQALVHPWNVELDWEPIPGTEHYEIQVAKDTSSFAAPWRTYTSTSSEIEDTFPIETAPTYYWRVRAAGPLGEFSQWSDHKGPARNFKIAPDSTNPHCTEPTSNQPIYPTNITAEWTMVPGATGYRIDLYEEGDYMYSEDVDDSHDSLALAASLFEEGKHYTLQIDAVGPGGAGGGSSEFVCEFDIYEPPPAPPCNTKTEAGSDDYEEHVYEMGQSSGTVTLEFRTYTLEDRITVWYEGVKKWETECVSTFGDIVTSPPIHYSGSSTQMKVTVDPRCDAWDPYGTQWEFTLSCP